MRCHRAAALRLAALVMLLASATLASLLSATNAAAREPLAQAPYRIDYNGWYTVEMMVNGEGPYDFIIDTGASISLVFENLAEQQAFAPSNQPLRRILGLSQAQTLPPYKIGELALGDEKLNDLVSVVLDDWSAPRRTPHGVLGLDFLTRYIVVFDAKARTVSLYDPANAPSDIYRRWARAPLRPNQFDAPTSRPLYTITPKVQGRPIPFILDLGASGTLINYAALRSFLPAGTHINLSASAGRLAKDQTIYGLFEDEEKAQLVAARYVRLGSAYWGRTEIFVLNPSVFDELGVRDAPFGLFGGDMLRGRSFALDFSRQRIYISKPQRR